MMKPSVHARTHRNMGITPQRRAQRGVSLIELMVGITIGLLVSVAAVGTLIYNRVSSTTITDTVALQQDAATIMRMIGRQLKQAGAVPALDDVDAPGKFIYRDDYVGVDAGSPTPISVTGENDGEQDELTVGYSNVANIAAVLSDCMGESPNPLDPNENVVTSRFELDNGAIRCEGTDAGAVPQPLINNVEELQFWYAVRDTATNQMRYFQADGVLNWATAEAVQVCIRIVGTSRNNPTGGAASTGCTGQAVADDGRIRRVFRQVFSLRNLQSLG